MDPAVIFLAVLIIVLVSGGITLTVSAIRRFGITQLARKPLLDSGQHVAEQVWRVREVSESPHLRVIAAPEVTSTDLALIRIEQTLTALPNGHHDLAELLGDRLATTRAMRSAVVANMQQYAEAPLREMVGGVAAGLVRGLAAAPPLTDYPNVRRALTTSGTDHTPGREPAVVNSTVRRVQEGIDRFLGRRNIGPAQDLLSRVGIGMSSEAGDLLDRMEDVGALVTPEYLDQLVDESDDALHTVTTALQQLERELAAASRGEAFRRSFWPSVGDQIAQDTVAYGRAVLLLEHQSHRELRSAAKILADADARLRGTVWALTLRDLPPGAITSPDLTAIAPALDSYLRTRPLRPPRGGAGDPQNP